MNDYVSKPIKMASLAAALRSFRGGEAADKLLPSAETGSLDGLVLDHGVLRAFRATLGPEAAVVNNMLDLFLKDGRAQVEGLRPALRDQNIRVVQRLAHTLRSNSATFGALGLARCCQELETSCREGDLTHLESQVSAVESEFPRVARALENERCGPGCREGVQ
jgi:HPt (histidine-containing phosphotransfer) domain-containing protein